MTTPRPEAEELAEPVRAVRAELTLSPTFGPGIWLDRRLVARVVASVEDSRVTEEEPVPRWRRDAEALVEAANRGFALAAAKPSPTADALDVERVVRAIHSVAARHGIKREPPMDPSLARIYGYSTTPADMNAQIAAEYDRLAPTEPS